MKTSPSRWLLGIGSGLALLTGNVLAQEANSGATSVPLSYGVAQILKLSQAKIGEETIISYIKNTGNSYPLNADQIIFLRQQGVSDSVLQTMLKQPRTGFVAASTSGQGTVVTPMAGQYGALPESPTVTYVPTVPATYYYYYSQPTYYPASYYYPISYGWSYPVGSIGWGGYCGGWRGAGWHGWGGWRGYYGGWHGYGYRGWRGYGGWHGYGYGGWRGNVWHGGTAWHGYSGGWHGSRGGMGFSGHGGMAHGSGHFGAGHFGGHR